MRTPLTREELMALAAEIVRSKDEVAFKAAWANYVRATIEREDEDPYLKVADFTYGFLSSTMTVYRSMCELVARLKIVAIERGYSQVTSMIEAIETQFDDTSAWLGAAWAAWTADSGNSSRS